MKVTINIAGEDIRFRPSPQVRLALLSGLLLNEKTGVNAVRKISLDGQIVLMRDNDLIDALEAIEDYDAKAHKAGAEAEARAIEEAGLMQAERIKAEKAREAAIQKAQDGDEELA